MSDAIFWMLELSIKEGEVDTLKEMIEIMSDATQENEPGALNYEWYISADEKSCHIFERYADSAAMLTHLNNFGKNFAKDFMSILTPTKFTVYGHPTEQLQKALRSMNPVFFDHLGGFSRDQM